MNILHTYWEKAISYTQYKQALNDYLNNKPWPINQYPSDYLHYVELAKIRMDRIDTKGKLSEEVLKKAKSIENEIYLLVITELWCGDAGQIIPYINLLALSNPNIKLKLIWRDAYPKLIDAYLTNGSRSIPKLIAINPSKFSEIAQWGPRPKEAQNIMHEFKKNNNSDKEVLYKNLQLWYAKNKGEHTLQEILSTLLP
jgi:hypothetical protein